MITCADCTFWKHDAGHPDDLGQCVELVASDLVEITCDTDNAELWTSPEFGCNQGESR